MAAPIIILVSPQMGENIGAAARVMANFGLVELRLVAPRDGWPNPAAQTMSAGALPDVVRVEVFGAVEDAIADCSLVIATTARSRGMEKPVVNVDAAMDLISCTSGRCAVLFGAEKSGLQNGAVALATTILSYPVSADFSSLNLAQAVAVLSHAYSCRSTVASGAMPGAAKQDPASRAELIGMMEHFEDELARAGFFYPPEKRSVMTQNLRNMFTRSNWTSQEVRTFRGAIKALAWGRGKARIDRGDD